MKKFSLKFQCVLHGSFRKHFDEIQRIRRLFNDEAQEYLWTPARYALQDLDIEPNARHTIELYSKLGGV